MSEPIVAPLRAAYNDLTSRLDEASPEGDRDELKREIITLFKTVDQGITDLSQLKEDIRTLVEKFKQLSQGESGEPAPQFTGAAPATRAFGGPTAAGGRRCPGVRLRSPC